MKSDEQSTPNELFDKINRTFNFGLDVAASSKNKKCAKYFNGKENAFYKVWAAENVWCNPPYSRGAGGTLKWLIKGAQEIEANNCQRVCFLLMADTSTLYFKYAYDRGTIILLGPRVKFNGVKNSPKFGSMLVMFGKGSTPRNVLRWDWKGQQSIPFRLNGIETIEELEVEVDSVDPLQRVEYDEEFDDEMSSEDCNEM